MLIIDVITIFPQLFENIASYGVIKDGKTKNIYNLAIHNLRDFTADKHKKVDERPYGGGSGMLFTAQPICDCVNFIKEKNNIFNAGKQEVILLSPAGKKLKQDILKELSVLENIILICGRYEGVDERVKELVVDREISIGDYILTGGEIPAMVIIDGVTRLLAGILGKKESLINESFENGLLDFPQYTRPEIYKNLRVPDVLLTGNHKEIEKWRKEKSFELTKKIRPDLFDKST